MEKLCTTRTGMTTSNNDLFVRLWHEVEYKKINVSNVTFISTWFPYAKGGGFSRWYGLEEYVVHWKDNGYTIKNYKKNGSKKSASVRNEKYYFSPGITWSSVTSGTFSARYLSEGHIFDSGGSAIFPDPTDTGWLLALMNSKIMDYNLMIQNPTLNFQPGDIGTLPIILILNKTYITDKSEENILLCQIDWNKKEVSRDFKKNPLI